ncbi:hypothetical protein D3C84_643560 [compost metagenome]
MTDTKHVLEKHQVGLLGAQWYLTVLETFRVLRIPGRLAIGILIGVTPVDGERRVGQNPVEAPQFTTFNMTRI